MTKELTFEEIAKEKGIVDLFTFENYLDKTGAELQLSLFRHLRILADYFNGENNWVPEELETAYEIMYYYEQKRIGLHPIDGLYSLTPLFKRFKCALQAIQIIERDFPELIESFTKKK